MTKHRDFSLARFYHAIPNDLLHDYLRTFRVPAADGWADLNGDAFDEWLKQPERAEVEPLVRQHFRRCNDLSGKHMQLVIAASNRFEFSLNKAWTPEANALNLLVACPEGFDYAWGRYLVYANAETLTDYYFAAPPLDIGADAQARLKRQVSAHLDRTAKGKQCRVRIFRDNEEVFVVVQRGHYLKTVSMFEDESDEIMYRSFRPALDDVMVFNERTRILRIKAPSREDREAYLAMLATLTDDPQEVIRVAQARQLYSLTPLRDGTFSFQGAGSIQGVRLVRGRYRVGARATIQYEAEDILPLVAADGHRGVLVSASLVFGFRNGRRDLRWVRADITPPSRGKLPEEFTDEVDDYLRGQGVKLM